MGRQAGLREMSDRAGDSRGGPHERNPDDEAHAPPQLPSDRSDSAHGRRGFPADRQTIKEAWGRDATALGGLPSSKMVSHHIMESTKSVGKWQATPSTHRAICRFGPVGGPLPSIPEFPLAGDRDAIQHDLCRPTGQVLDFEPPCFEIGRGGDLDDKLRHSSLNTTTF